jgi:sulfatase modifying factor 1
MHARRISTRWSSWLISGVVVALLGGCLVESVCTRDGDCPDERYCRLSDGQCLPRCLNDDDCLPDERCETSTGRCHVACTSDEQCAARQRCDASVDWCVDVDCTLDAHCPDGFVCLDYRCKPEGGGPLDCPEGMVSIEDAYCMDRYEASRPDARADSAGSDESKAVSVAGVLPWVVNPMSGAMFDKFQKACQSSGKHLCTPDEWSSACSGPDASTYVFGDVFDPEICNCVDTFCDDYCTEHDIDNCITSANCGYTYDAFHLVPTGTFAQCTNTYGTFDLNGNAWEAVSSATDARGFEVRGGAFNCASASQRLQCSYNAGWSDLYAGFRCCWKPGER